MPGGPPIGHAWRCQQGDCLRMNNPWRYVCRWCLEACMYWQMEDE